MIQSDAFKALWFLVYPLVELTTGNTPPESPFCQGSGFLVTVGIEACDVAVVLVALHTVLYIFRGRNGLYEYRYYAYAVWILFPITLASLAFINDPGFINSGEFCYLPIHPAWTRQALSWAPRYLILLTILVVYTYIYIYVTIIMQRSGAVRINWRGRASIPSSNDSAAWPSAQSPSIPLGPYPAASRRSTLGPRDHGHRRQSATTLSIAEQSGRETGSGPSWPSRYPRIAKLAGHRRNGQLRSYPPSSGGLGRTESLATPPETASHLLRPSRRHRAESNTALAASPTSTPGTDESNLQWPIPVSQSTKPPPLSSIRSTSCPDSSGRVAQGGLGLSTGNTGIVQLPATAEAPNADQADLDISAMGLLMLEENRGRIRRQLRFLFIYPVVYTAVWALPFVSHILGGDTTGAPFGLVLASAVSITAQGAADSLVFCCKEKPWRHVRTGPPKWRLRFWRHEHWAHRNPNVGRTREEMRVERRIATNRRNQELADRRQCQEEKASRGPREWWDYFQIDEPNEEDENEEEGTRRGLSQA